MALIKGGLTAAILEIFGVSNSAHVRVMDDNNQPLARRNVDVWDNSTSRGFAAMGVNPITGQIDPLSLDRGGRLRQALFTPLFYDSFYSNTTINFQLWQLLSLTFSASQTPQQGLLINSSSSTAANSGYALKSNRRFLKYPGSTLAFRASARVVKANNSIIEMGFADAGAQFSVAPTAILDQSVGAYWRFTAAGNLVPVVSFNNTDVLLGSPVTFTNQIDFFDFLVTVEDLGFRFAIYAKSGALINEQILASPPGLPRELAQPSLSAFIGVRNTASSPPSAPVVTVGQISVGRYNSQEVLTHAEVSALQSNGIVTTPSNLTQQPIHPASGTAPTTATLVSTSAACGTSLGGKFLFTGLTGTETDLGLFSILNSDAVGAGMTFMCTGVRIDAVVVGAAIATSPTTMEISLFVNDSINPSTTNNRKLPLGVLSYLVGAAIGTKDFIDVDFPPVAMLPNRVLGTTVRVISGTAGPNFRGSVLMKGYWIA